MTLLRPINSEEQSGPFVRRKISVDPCIVMDAEVARALCGDAVSIIRSMVNLSGCAVVCRFLLGPAILPFHPFMPEFPFYFFHSVEFVLYAGYTGRRWKELCLYSRRFCGPGSV